ncbi:hypothetical protein [Roseofilum casamattae]|uniref:Uncharacterized protein n=1 Tax=Roseofilum casamattae BLCC-M143 TaxID=3022442 RepID=A0ABT7C2B1_9CYAN|nr:hypothetical protein [Roseofilum casamattae]MDJ1185574.1 hypothetical protein [Roseofilum casamattae BLCC-M143]
MVITVICINLGISLLCWWVAWRIHRLTRRLTRITAVLNRVEQRTHRLLFPAPDILIRGQRGTRVLRDKYALLARQWEQAEQLLAILSGLFGIWQRRSRHQR